MSILSMLKIVHGTKLGQWCSDANHTPTQSRYKFKIERRNTR